MTENEPGLFLRIKNKIFYIATHYTWAFFIVVGISVVSCAFSIHYLSNLESGLQDVYENDIRGGDAIRTAYVALLGIENSVKDLEIHQDQDSQSKARTAIRDQEGILRSAVDRSDSKFRTPKARQAYLAAKDHLKAYTRALEETLDAADQGKGAAEQAVEKLEGRGEILEQDFELLIANRNANSSRGIMEMIGQLRFSLVCSLVILGATLTFRIVMYIAGHPGRKKPPESGHLG